MPRRFITYYYLMTPVFWVADVAFGANLRAAALEGFPFWKATYYLFCFACGVASWRHPRWTSVVGLSEASSNIFLLILGVLAPYFRMIDQLAAGSIVVDASPFTGARVVGFLLSGLIWVASFQLHMAARRSAGLRF